MMKKAVKGAYAAKLQQHTVASGIIEAPAPVTNGEGERVVQGNDGDMSAVTSSSSLPSTSHEVDNGFLPIPVPVLAPVPAYPSSTGEEDGASTSLSLILTIPPSTSAPSISSSSSSSAPAPTLVPPLSECPPLSNDVDEALSSFTTSGKYVYVFVRSPVYSVIQ
jgi:hypothetical protein